ncbi:CYP3A4 [Bugula neritina]|uniref:CYP3A4 n=1 Tax=Bugula neritina TaxID=10212 RepID=A0A7J7JUP4_BUGNE|nr:CYP3A4 [Bugula neritina]
MQIPKGMAVDMLVYNIHHDSDYWKDPEIFNPDRFAPENQTDIQQYAFLPFGSGSRKCIASRLALLEMKVVIIKSLTEFRYEACADTPKLRDLKFQDMAIGLLTSASPLHVSAVQRESE